MRLLGENAKTKKTERILRRWVVRMMHFAPAKVSGHEVCKGRTPGCTFACLYSSGLGVLPSVQESRIDKTRWFFEDRSGFLQHLNHEIAVKEWSAKKKGKKLAVRLNGTSDLDWLSTIENHPKVQFYDYTKIWSRYVDWLGGLRPVNEHLVWSLAETPESEAHARWAMQRGGSVAVVTTNRASCRWLLTTARDRFVDGDRHDLRFMDQPGAVVLLSPKGRAKKDKKGFVVR